MKVVKQAIHEVSTVAVANLWQENAQNGMAQAFIHVCISLHNHAVAAIMEWQQQCSNNYHDMMPLHGSDHAVKITM